MKKPSDEIRRSEKILGFDTKMAKCTRVAHFTPSRYKPCFCVHLVSLLLVRTSFPSAAHLSNTMAALPSIDLLHSFAITSMGQVGLSRVDYHKI